MRIPCVLSIAGSDSGGGAGIQADIKAFAACGVHGMTAITAVTAQNTVAVTVVEAVSPALILAQVRAVALDIGVDAVKVGMLGDEATIDAVAMALDELGDAVPVVVDPVMVAESGGVLLAGSARAALIASIVPRATVLTPNLPEAAALLAQAGAGAGDMAGADDASPAAQRTPGELARAVHALGSTCVVVTGGHALDGTDVFFDGDQLVEISGERHPDGAAHGSGCTHSSALAAHLALGLSPLDAARAARAMAARAVRDGLRSVGRGAGPVDALGVAARLRRTRGEVVT